MVDGILMISSPRKRISAHEIMRDWYTAKIIKDKLDDLRFFTNFSIFNNDLHEVFKELKTYSDKHYHDARGTFYGCSHNQYDSIEGMYKSIAEFQLFLLDSPSLEDIKEKSLALFNTPDYSKGEILIMDKYDKLQMLVEYASEAGGLCNYVNILCSGNNPIPDSLEREIKDFLDKKGLTTFNSNYQKLLVKQV